MFHAYHGYLRGGARSVGETHRFVVFRHLSMNSVKANLAKQAGGWLRSGVPAQLAGQDDSQ